MTEAKHASVLELCRSAIGRNSQQLNQQLRSIYLPSYGLDHFVDSFKRTVLHVLAEDLKFDHWEIILKGFIGLDATDSHLRTALHRAVEKQNLRAIHYLILNSCSPIIEDEHGMTPIQIACKHDYSDGLKEILQSFPARQFVIKNAIELGKLCIEEKSIKCFELVVAYTPQSKINTFDEDGYALIHRVILADLPDYLRILLKHHADINLKVTIDKSDKYPLELAQSRETAELLFSRGASFNKKNQTDIISHLQRESSQWQQTGHCFYFSDLHKYVKEGNKKAIEQYSGEVDIISSSGLTPLILAIQMNEDAIIEELVTRHGDPNLKKADPNLVRGPMKYSAYHYACMKNRVKTVQLFLLSQKPNLTIVDYANQSIATSCFINGAVDCLKILLPYKPNFDLNIMKIMEYLLRMKDETATEMLKNLLLLSFPLNIPTFSNKSFLREAFDRKKYKMVIAILNYITKLVNEKNEKFKSTQEKMSIMLQTEQPCFIDAVVNELDETLISAFLKAGLSPEINSDARPLIHETAGHVHNNIRNLLLESHKDLINVTDFNKNTFLHRAALLNNDVAIDDALNAYNLSPNAKNSYGDTPLHCLMAGTFIPPLQPVQSSHFVPPIPEDIQEQIIDDYDEIDPTPPEPVKYSPFLGEYDKKTEVISDEIKERICKENLDKLLQANADIRAKNNKGQNVFHICALHNYAIGVKTLISTLNEETIQILINEHDNDNKTAIEIASKERNESTECARAFSSICHMAIFDSPLSVKSVQKHVEDGYSLNIYNTSGIPLLSSAIMMFPEDPQESIELVKTILSFNGDPSIMDLVPNDEVQKPLSPLHHAIIAGSTEIASMLCEKGASFAVSPAIVPFADEHEQPDIAALTKSPDRRASSIEELYGTQFRACEQFRGLIHRLDENSNLLINRKVEHYISDLTYMHRLLRQFSDRLHQILETLTPASEIGPFMLYFKDAFVPILGVSAEYQECKETLEQEAAEFVKLGVGIGSQSVGDVLIVPTQVFTWYSQLISPVLKYTPPEHPDYEPLQAANNKYQALGSQVTENQRIADSQKKLQSLKLVTTINDQATTLSFNDILYIHGQFEKKLFKKPGGAFESDAKTDSESSEWGLKTVCVQMGSLRVNSYIGFGSSMDSFINKNKIAIYLLKNAVLFGVQKGLKTSEKFKLKFSCKPTEVFWDFNAETPDSFMVYAPFGSFLLKFISSNGPNEDISFEKNEWMNNIQNMSKFQDADEELSPRGFEYVYASWVGEESKSIHSHMFYTECQNKTEAKEKIINKLKSEGIQIKCSNKVPMINFDFQTFQQTKGQDSVVLSDIPY